MKTLIENIAANIVIYGLLILLITGIAYGAEMIEGYSNSADTNPLHTELTFDDEEYVDDIPFDTEAIATAYYYEESLNTEYQFTDEAYVDDIPFDTNKIVYDDTDTYASIK